MYKEVGDSTGSRGRARQDGALKHKLALAALALLPASLWTLGAVPAAAQAAKSPPLRNPALLNIGFVCKWQERCIRRQQSAMSRALGYVRKYRPPSWKVQLCNRNAGRNGTRVDWIGFDNCVRNPALRPAPTRQRRR